jgi:GNAT superfamily N-acetyltransferase
MRAKEFIIEGSNTNLDSALNKMIDGYLHGRSTEKNTCYSYVGQELARLNPEHANIRFWGRKPNMIVHGDAVLDNGNIISSIPPEKYEKYGYEVVDSMPLAELLSKLPDSLNEIHHVSDFTPEESRSEISRAWKMLHDNSVKIGELNGIELQAGKGEWPLSTLGASFFLIDHMGEAVGLMHVNSDGNFYTVSNIQIAKDYQNKGLGLSFYKFLLDHGYKLISDTDQTFGGRNIWSRLAKEYPVYGYNSETNKKFGPVTDTSPAYNSDKYRLLSIPEKQMNEDEPIRIKLSDNSAAKAWIQKVYDMFPHEFQYNHVIPLDGTGNDQQVVLFELTPSLSKRGAVEIKWIQAVPLRAGAGTKGMKILQDLAREDGITLTLYPWDKGVVKQGNLIKFYRKQGYKPMSTGSKSMIWEPERTK